MNAEEARGASTVCPSTYDLSQAYRARKDDAEDFKIAWSAFEAENGMIVENFFAPLSNSAVLLTKKNRSGKGGWRRPLLRRNPEERTYRIRHHTDGGVVNSELEEVVRSARNKEREFSPHLNRLSQHTLAQEVYALIAYALKVADSVTELSSHQEQKEKIEAAKKSADREIKEIRSFAEKEARLNATVYYMLGVPLGAVLFTAIVGWAVPYVLPVVEIIPIDMRNDLNLCFLAGAVGASISVMVRVSRGYRSLDVDYDQGRIASVAAGALRPAIGAIFGGALYILVSAKIIPLEVPDGVPSILFYSGLAFLAGFSERWAQDTIVHSAPTIGRSGNERTASGGASGSTQG